MRTARVYKDAGYRFTEDAKKDIVTAYKTEWSELWKMLSPAIQKEVLSIYFNETQLTVTGLTTADVQSMKDQFFIDTYLKNSEISKQIKQKISSLDLSEEGQEEESSKCPLLLDLAPEMYNWLDPEYKDIIVTGESNLMNNWALKLFSKIKSNAEQ